MIYVVAVPHSELAMHLKIAGKNIIAYQVNPFGRSVTIWIEGEDPTRDRGNTGLISELLPYGLREQAERKV